MTHENSIESYYMGLKDYKPLILEVLAKRKATRQDLAELFGCDVGSVCAGVKSLINDNLIIESGKDRSTGRPRALLTINRGHQHELQL
jgi:chromosome segregation and condensation protein ScpB